MSVAWLLARRELRRGGRGLLLLALCLFLGTAALAGIGSLSASVLAALDAQGRTMLGGDLELAVSQRRATVEENAAFAAAGRTSETVSTSAMAGAPGRPPLLVDLRGVDAAWPLVGAVRLAAGALAARPAGDEAAVAPAVAERLGLHVGDRIRLGAASLRIIGLIADEPDRLGTGFALGPPVLVDLAGLDDTRLIQPGSLYESRYRIVLAQPGRARQVGDQLVRRFRDAGWTARTSGQAAGGLRRGLSQLGQFLLLVGLAALSIAGVGVAGGVTAYLDGKARWIATLKTLGATSGTVAASLLLQLGLVGLAAVGAGLALGAAVPWLVAGIAGDALPVAPRLALYPQPQAVAAALALLVGLLAATMPLARARQLPAASLFRAALVIWPRPAVSSVLAQAALTGLLAALTILTASDRTMAAAFVAAIAALLALLWLLGRGIRALAKRLPRPSRPLLRLAIANLHRPCAPTERLVVALGLGFSLFVALATIDASLSAELTGAAPARAPRFFATDLQAEDLARFRAAVAAAAPGARIEAVPSLRGSIVAIAGRRVADMKALPAAAWVLRGDRTVTWSATVPPRNRVVAGRWWPRGYHGPPLVSLEDRAAAALKLRVGDTITVSVLGVDVPARLAALRTIDRSALGLNFAIVFSPGYIEEAPHGLLASVYAAPERDDAVAGRLAAVLPSITVIRVGDVIARIGRILAQVATAVRAAAAITVAAGVAVLAGAVAAAERSRRYDAVVLKLLGASSPQVLVAQGLEYLLLAAVVAAVALVLGSVAGWLVVRHVFDLAWTPVPWMLAATLAASAATTLVVGMIGSLSALQARAAAILRDAS